ncbi:unnamed protein product [Closterium sp. NIES-65]|nr:unnamed protein product [Closterium sp. NIES-65]
MDWGNVTGEELLDALREVEWSTPPRPLAEFVQRFSAPKNASNYRTNYYILVCFINACCFARNPLALFAVLFAAVAFASLNDRSVALAATAVWLGSTSIPISAPSSLTPRRSLCPPFSPPSHLCLHSFPPLPLPSPPPLPPLHPLPTLLPVPYHSPPSTIPFTPCWSFFLGCPLPISIPLRLSSSPPPPISPPLSHTPHPPPLLPLPHLPIISHFPLPHPAASRCHSASA